MRAPNKNDVTQARLKELLKYDKRTGRFTRLVRRGPALAGSIAGTVMNHGYRCVGIDGTQYLEHRLAWLYVKGVWPELEIDHKNGVKDDNRWTNLREATHAQNTRNAALRKDNKTGTKGVYWIPRFWAFVAMIRTDNKRRTIGKFATFEEAKAAVELARAQEHKEFARHS